MPVKKRSLSKIINIVRLNWLELFKSPKIYLIIFSYICITERCFLPMLRLSEDIDEYMNIYEPFINFCNSEIESILVPLVFVVLFCDFPKANSHYTFTLVRSGRINWLIGNITFAITASFAYIISIFGLSVLICQKRCFLFNGWSMYTRKMKYYYADKLLQAGEDKVLQAGIYMHYSPISAFVFTILINVLFATFIACIFLLCNILQLRNVGMFSNILLLIAGWVTNLFQTNSMWWLPYANSKIGWHNKYMLEETVVSDGYSVAYFLIALGILFIGLYKQIRKVPIYVSDNV